MARKCQSSYSKKLILGQGNVTKEEEKLKAFPYENKARQMKGIYMLIII
jgi:hypothetical protein